MPEPAPPVPSDHPGADGGRVGWIDATFGIAGDMLLAALLDAGADVQVVRAGVAAVVGDAVRIEAVPTARRGQRATAVQLAPATPDAPHRPWRVIRDLIAAAELPPRARDRALAVFGRLAQAEGRVHGVPEDEVVFHEVGSWDSIGDIVGVCVALEDLGVDRLSSSTLTLGEGTVASAHGLLPVPGPAVRELLAGSGVRVRSLPPGAETVEAGGRDPVGELATPTGVALLVTLCSVSEQRTELTGPPTIFERVGTGAGQRDTPGWANVTRVVLGPATPDDSVDDHVLHLLLLETTVDDLDPRIWPSVLRECLDAGGLDAWLVPALGKKGRPAQVLSVLLDPADDSAERVRAHVLAATGTLGFRESTVRRTALRRVFRQVLVRLDGRDGPVEARIPVKVGVRAGRIVHATPEYEDCAALAAGAGRPVLEALEAARAAAHAADLVPGAACDDAV